MQSFFIRPLALAALLCAGAAHAAVPYVTTSAFTLQGYENYPDSVVNLLADTGRSITLGLPTFAAELSTGRADSVQGPGDPATGQAFTQARYGIGLRDNYRITGVTLSGIVQGTLQTGGGDAPGFALNYLHMDYDIWGGDSGSGEIVNLDGTRTLELRSGSLALDRSFDLLLSGYTNLGAMGGYLFDPVSGATIRTQSLAAIGLRDVTLTFTVAAIPEPQTWLLMLSGLTAVGAAALRSRKRG